MVESRGQSLGSRGQSLGRLAGRVGAQRKVVALSLYGLVTAVAFLGAWLLRFEIAVPPGFRDEILVALPLLVGIRVLTCWFCRLSTRRWRFIGPRDMVRLWVATTVGTVVFWAAVTATPGLRIPLAIYPLEWTLTMLLTAAMWLGYRLVFEELRIHGSGNSAPRKRVLVVGAGDAGNQLAREIARAPTPYELLGFLDDGLPAGTTVQGYHVLGSTDEIAQIAARTTPEEVIIAIPSASPAVLREIVTRCEAAELPIQVLPGISQVLNGEARVAHIRELRLEDLLGREPVTLELPELERDLAGRTVLITGAAGSIGSELARQIATNGPGRLVLLDRGETPLFYVEMELREAHPELEIVPVVLDILDQPGLEACFERHRPHRVFHAAAYKHVPLMEGNVRAAFRNNVLGTLRVASLCGEREVERFVLVSTDKAVRPLSVMGATKRLAELAVLAVRRRHPDTWYTAVRFGNVLGSQGSVIPIFRRQLETTRVLTVTHPEVTRFFMTIPEAVQLILQASLLPEARGRIAMLEMGEPVRIDDLARDLIRLSGLREGVDARIAYTGLRPGEKLHEVLSNGDETATETAVERVRLVETPCEDGQELLDRLGRMARRVDRVSEHAIRSFLWASAGDFTAEHAEAGAGNGPPSAAAKVRAS